MANPSSEPRVLPLEKHQIRWAVHEYYDRDGGMSAWHAFDRWLSQVKAKARKEGRLSAETSRRLPNPYKESSWGRR